MKKDYSLSMELDTLEYYTEAVNNLKILTREHKFHTLFND